MGVAAKLYLIVFNRFLVPEIGIEPTTFSLRMSFSDLPLQTPINQNDQLRAFKNRHIRRYMVSVRVIMVG